MHPIEAGLPPLIEVLDEVGSSVAFDNRWAVHAARAARRRGDWRPPSGWRWPLGVKLEHLRSLARAFQSDWDLIESHVLAGGAPTVPSMPDLAGAPGEPRELADRAGGECTQR